MPASPATSKIRFIVIMGVAGSGKTTVGTLVATKLGWRLLEADEFHPESNKAKMGAGTPLTDADREPWLAAIRAAMDACLQRNEPAVVTCSALRERYRDRLLRGLPEGAALLVFLDGDPATILERVRGRSGHFMKENMVHSQLEALEPPRDALKLDIRKGSEAIAAEIVAVLYEA